jgi:hypothetical protein
MVLSVRRRIADTARAEPDRTALVGFGTDLAEQVMSWRGVVARRAHECSTDGRLADALRELLG